MGCGSIIGSTKVKPMDMEGKSFMYKFNPRTKLYVKFRK
jgi:hypothetical protein